MSRDTGIAIRLTLNGEEVAARVEPGDRLLDLLRYGRGLTGTKEGCGEGECGACTVLLDDVPVNSCLIPAWQVRDRVVETVESVPEVELSALLESGATQCGACTPGVVMTAWWVLRNREVAHTHSLRELMAGNLCRCTGYDGIVEGLEAWLESANSDAGSRSEGDA